LLERVPGVTVKRGAATPSVTVAEDPEATRRKLEERLRAARAERDRARSMLAHEGFTSRAPRHLIDAERDKAERFASEAAVLEAQLEEV
ncbi:MAG: hypothetical protein ACXVYV_03490, partial [Gaiellales bacterium]